MNEIDRQSKFKLKRLESTKNSVALRSYYIYRELFALPKTNNQNPALHLPLIRFQTNLLSSPLFCRLPQPAMPIHAAEYFIAPSISSQTYIFNSTSPINWQKFYVVPSSFCGKRIDARCW